MYFCKGSERFFCHLLPKESQSSSIIQLENRFKISLGINQTCLLFCLRTCRWPAAPCEKQPESDTSTQLGSFMLIVGVKWSWDVCRAPSHPSIRVSSGFMFSLRPRIASRGTDHLKMPLLLSVVRSFVAGQSKMSFQPDTCRGSTGD